MANDEHSRNGDRTRNFRRGQKPTELEVKAQLAHCLTRNRQGAELVFSLLATAKENPFATETPHIIALKDVLIAIHVTLTGHRPDENPYDDDGGEFKL